MSSRCDVLAVLRQRLARLEPAGAPAASSLFGLGLSAVDEPLGGGLARGRLHEAFAAVPADGPAAAGFALALAMRAAAGRPIAWIRQDFSERETGALYAPGLAALGLDPRGLLLVRAGDGATVLKAGIEAVRCPALGAVLIEPWGEARGLDLTASRRLALAAGASGVTTFLVRVAAEPAPSAAMSRWQVRAAASRPLAANAPGPAAFAIALLRHRAGLAACAWLVEWNRDRGCFDERPPLPRRLAAVPAGRPAAPALAEGALRKAG